MWEKIWSFIEQALGGDKYAPPVVSLPPVTPIEPNPAPQSLLEAFCTEIKSHEGANPLNNNPGNCKFYHGGYLAIYGNVTCNPHGFAVFPTYTQGWLYLENLVTNIVKTHTGLTFLTFFAGNGSSWAGYAPASDGNNPPHYAQLVATACGQQVDNLVDVILG